MASTISRVVCPARVADPTAWPSGAGESARAEESPIVSRARVAWVVRAARRARGGRRHRACGRCCARGCGPSRHPRAERGRSARWSGPAGAAAALRPHAWSAGPRPQPHRDRPSRDRHRAGQTRGITCSPREARWIALITSRDWVLLPRQALAPNASSCAHSTGAGSFAEQDQASGRIAGAELADLGQLSQGAGVEDRHIRTVRAQHDADPPVLHVGGDDREARIALDQLAQSSGEEIVEVGEDYGYGGMWRHRRPRRGPARYVLIGSTAPARVSRASPPPPPQLPPRSPSWEEEPGGL